MLSLALRNFTRNLSRYRVLLASLTLAVVALIVLIGLVEGVSSAIREKSARYFAGDVTIQQFRRGSSHRLPDAEAVRGTIEGLELPLVTPPLARSLYTDTDATLFFAGRYINQRRLAGVDWQNERPVLERFEFVSGGVPDEGDERGLLVSSAVADRLRASVGDEMILSLTTERGQANTVRLELRGVFHEHSFFGYQAYLARETLNRTMDVPEDAVYEIGLQLPGARQERAAARRVHEALSEEHSVMSVFTTRDERSEALREQRSERESGLGIMTIEAHLDEVTNLLEALTLISGAIIAVFLIIVVVGVSNTYVMITFERTREIGTLRAMGLSRASTLGLFLSEAAIMGTVAVALGVPLGLGALELLRHTVDLSGYSWATLFLVRGRLAWVLPPLWLGVVFAAVAGSAVLGCLKPAARAAGLPPVEALQHD